MRMAVQQVQPRTRTLQYTLGILVGQINLDTQIMCIMVRGVEWGYVCDLPNVYSII
jgi:hypothetical protein